MKKKIIDNAIFILGVLAAIFFLLFNNKMGLIIIGLDIFAILIAILLIINKNKLGIVLAIISSTVAITLFLHHIKYFDRNESITFFLVFSLLATTVFSTLKYIKQLYDDNRNHEMLVVAQIVDLVKNPNIARDYYIPVLEYEIKGEKFEVNYNEGFSKNVPELGTLVNIFVNPNDYYDVYFKPATFTVIRNIGANVILAIITLVILSGILH